MSTRSRRVAAGMAVWIVALALALGAVFSGATLSRSPARAASPSSGAIVVPANFVGTLTTSWSGQASAGTNALAIRCVDFTGTVADQLSDVFLLQLSGVDATFYQTHRVQLIVRITWTPVSGSYDLNDLGLTTYLDDGAGNQTNFQDSHQLGSNFEQIAYSNPLAATGQAKYHLNTCPDNNASPQNYAGSATLISSLIPSSSNVKPGTQTFTNYDFPLTYQTRDLLMRPNAG